MLVLALAKHFLHGALLFVVEGLHVSEALLCGVQLVLWCGVGWMDGGCEFHSLSYGYCLFFFVFARRHNVGGIPHIFGFAS